MTPADFLAQVAHPNATAAFKKPGDMRLIVNAILTLDALAGIIHADGFASGREGIAEHARDDRYREALAEISPSFRVLRDAAATLKHGYLSDPRKKGPGRLLSRAEAFQAVENTLGLMECGDELDGDVVMIEIKGVPGYVRASDVTADSFRMLKRIVAGGPAETDEHDRRSFVDLA